MNYPRKTVDAVSVVRATDTAKEHVRSTIERALNATNDPKKVDRLAEGLCLSCFYIYTMRVGGATCTTQPCGICDKPMHFGNTCTDVVCAGCSAAHELCRHCGADIKLRVRRVFKRPEAS